MVKTKSKAGWKPVKIDPSLYASEGFDNLVSFEELTDYQIIDGKIVTNVDKKQKKGKVKKKDLKKNEEDSILSQDSSTNLPNKKKTENKSSESSKEKGNSDHDDKRVQKNRNKKKAKAEKRKITDEESCPPNKKQKKVTTKTASSDNQSEISHKTDLSAWKDLFVPTDVLTAFSELGFSAPTPIQALALPAAIRDRRDVVGAAETGSGKTLAFGVPIIHHILSYKERKSNTSYSSDIEESHDTELSHDADSQEEPDHSPHKEEESDDVIVDEDDQEIDDDYDDEEGSEDENNSDHEDIEEDGDDEKGCVAAYDLPDDVFSEKVMTPDRPLLALILEPTRELAIQVKNHLKAAAKHTDLQIVSVVGGMSEQKQQRLLKRMPEIVVATPGRLWELIQDGDPHLSKVTDVHKLVVDEADRMVEKGHFEELTKLLDFINGDEKKLKKRQTFIFSATLTLVHSGPQRFIKKKKKISMTQKQKLESLMSTIGIKEKPMVIDLTRKSATAETLTEARLLCTLDEKDMYLYYFRVMHPGRTVVFANSKDCIRRLVSIFSLLKCCPLPLHADMHQRQRLKNLDRFKGNPSGFLLATDVAARGLDIPDVQHVIHYQVPRTTENYVHRSGRTARASKEGLSVMLVGPDDMKNYKKIIHTLNRNEDLPSFPLEQEVLSTIKSRVGLAREIDKDEYRSGRSKKQNNWFVKAAEDMDLALDEDELLNDLGDSGEQAHLKSKLKHMKSQLNSMLNQPLLSRSFSGRYPTQTGKLILPYEKDYNALEKMRKKEKTVPDQSLQKSGKSQKKRKRKFFSNKPKQSGL